MPVTIYHNPRCSKSRQTLALLEEKGVDLDTILYLQDPPDAATIADLVAKLDLASARDLMRKGEAVYKELGLKDVTDETVLIRAMADHPILIERPIVLNGDKARIGRPPEGVLEIV
jgi:arsenate reductase